METNKTAEQSLTGNLFTIKNDLRDSAGIYEVMDENGTVAILQGAMEYDFFKGKQVRCNIISTEGTRPMVMLAEKPAKTGSAFSISLSYLKSLLPDNLWKDSISELILYNGMEDSFETRAYTWLIKNTEGLEGKELDGFLCDVRHRLLCVLENSDLLRRVSSDESDILNDRICLIIEHTGYIRTALKAITEGSESEYVNDIIMKLSESGFLYHPKKQFCIMTYIFMLKPQVMEHKINDLLKALRTKNLDHWKKEPFRTEIIKQIEQYVNVTEKKALYDDKGTWMQIFEALAIQLLLTTDNEELIDVSLNLAKMSRAGSYFKYASQARMADMAIDAIQGLLDNRFIYSLGDTSKSEILVHKMENWYRNLELEREQVSTYNAQGLSLEISNNRLTIMPDTDTELKTIFSMKENMPQLWKGMDIMLEKGTASRIPSIRKGEDRMTGLKRIWNAVEDGLFDSKRPKKARMVKSKTCPEVGDEVMVYIYRQEDDNTYRCMISDEAFYGQGLVCVKSDEKVPGIVSYFPKTKIEDFRSEDGNPLIIKVKVAKIEDDGTLIFDAKNLIYDFIRSNKPYFIQKCIVGKNPGGNTLLAVTDGGLPTCVQVDAEDSSDIMEGDHIEVTIDGSRWFVNGFVQGRFLRVIDSEDFAVEDAFHNLISSYAEEELEENSDNEIAEINLDKRHVEELMGTLDRLAAMEQGSDTGYCYVGFARILSRLIGDEARATGYRRQMEMIYLLHKFAVTDSVDVDEMKQIQEVCLSDDCPNSLRRVFCYLLIVSHMGKDNEALCERLSGIKLDETQELLKGYVYSYNILQRAGLPVDGLKAMIKQTLNLTGREGYVKTYDKGESQTIEFKTSILYPVGSKKGNLRVQTDNILKEVCAFLNRDGGTLFLGVNDQGVGIGLEDDMKFEMFKDSRDKYDLYVRDQIASHLGQAANHCVNSYFDDDACGRDVYVLEIQPCETAVSLYGEYYERQGSSSRKVSAEYKELFLKSRTLHKLPTGESTEHVQEIALKPACESGMIQEEIATGTFRNNVLHSYEQSYEYSEAYLHFLPDSKFKVCTEDTYEEDSTLLTLNLHAQDVDNGFIVTVYDSGEVAKTPVSTYLEKAEQKLHSCHSDANPIFISPAQKDDILYLSFEHKGTVFHRLENVSYITETGLKDAGEKLFDVAFDKILGADILPDSFRSRLPKVVSTRKKLGNFWKTAETEAMVRFLSEKGI